MGDYIEQLEGAHEAFDQPEVRVCTEFDLDPAFRGERSWLFEDLIGFQQMPLAAPEELWPGITELRKNLKVLPVVRVN